MDSPPAVGSIVSSGTISCMQAVQELTPTVHGVTAQLCRRYSFIEPISFFTVQVRVEPIGIATSTKRVPRLLSRCLLLAWIRGVHTRKELARGAEAELTVDMNGDGDRRWHITSSKGYSECHSRQLVMSSEEADASLIKLGPIGSHQIGLDETIHPSSPSTLPSFSSAIGGGDLGDRCWPSLSLSRRPVTSTWTDYSCFPGWDISCIGFWHIILSAI
ncbi:hypothetical protein BHE74_00058877 [Ensete ventricosum]|nr:hypothetical protein BHE74_00058877 [Ensete ventricosum]